MTIDVGNMEEAEKERQKELEQEQLSHHYLKLLMDLLRNGSSCSNQKNVDTPKPIKESGETSDIPSPAVTSNWSLLFNK